jgi:hypothetical protein
MNRIPCAILAICLAACVEYRVDPLVAGHAGPGAATEPSEPEPPAEAGEPSVPAESSGEVTPDAPAEETGAPVLDTAEPIDERGRNEAVRVPAVEPVPMGIQVGAGDRISFAANGTWCWGGGMDCSDGDGTSGRPIAEELPVLVTGASFGTLVGSIDGGAPFVIGTAAVVEMPASGELFLGMSDRLGYYADNSGELEVALTWE